MSTEVFGAKSRAKLAEFALQSEVNVAGKSGDFTTKSKV